MNDTPKCPRCSSDVEPRMVVLTYQQVCFECAYCYHHSESIYHRPLSLRETQSIWPLWFMTTEERLQEPAARIKELEEALAAAKQRIGGFGALLESKAVKHERLSRTIEQLGAESIKWKHLYEVAEALIKQGEVQAEIKGFLDKSRPMTPGERKVTNEFFWSQFKPVEAQCEAWVLFEDKEPPQYIPVLAVYNPRGLAIRCEAIFYGTHWKEMNDDKELPRDSFSHWQPWPEFPKQLLTPPPPAQSKEEA